MNTDVYKNAKSPRPAWANALIVALVLFVAAVVAMLMNGLGPLAFALLLAVVITLSVAAILALLGARKSA